MKTAVLTALIVFALIGVGAAQVEPSSTVASAPAHLSHKQVKNLIATASTAEDHRVLAQYFRREARKMKEEEQYHLEMAAIYRLHPLPYDGKQPYGMQMQNHCKYFADKARDASNSAEEMAIVHERMAEQLSQSQKP